MQPRILVTGANGFVGRVVTEHALEAGLWVTAAVRASKNDLSHPRLRTIEIGDINEETRWNHALEGVTAVVHLAGRAHVMGAKDDSIHEFRRVNAGGTRRLAECAAQAGVKRLVFVSSVKVHGESTGDGVRFRETDVPNPCDPYGVSKLEAELALLAVAKKTGLEYSIVRPPLVFGTEVRANFLSLLRAVDRGLPLPLGAVKNKRSLVSVWNLADLLITCAQHPLAAGEIFLAADARPLSTPELVRLLAQSLGRPARLLSVPPTAFGVMGALFGRGEQVRRLCGSLEVDASKALELLGWKPPVTLEEGLRRTAKWYQFVDGAAERRAKAR